MPTSTWSQPSFWRVIVFTLFLGLCANVLLWKVAYNPTWFTRGVSIASGVAAIMILVCWFRWQRGLADVLLLTFAIWIANTVEFALQDGIGWDSKTRQGAFYVSEGLLALGAYVARRVRPT